MVNIPQELNRKKLPLLVGIRKPEGIARWHYNVAVALEDHAEHIYRIRERGSFLDFKKEFENFKRDFRKNIKEDSKGLPRRVAIKLNKEQLNYRKQVLKSFLQFQKFVGKKYVASNPTEYQKTLNAAVMEGYYKTVRNMARYHRDELDRLDKLAHDQEINRFKKRLHR
jgi:hypothetical protein